MLRGYLGSLLDNMMSSNRSNIDQLLDNKDTPLERVLNDNEILTECKWGNQRLINYFDHDKVSQLLDYIITMPPEDATHERGHRLPFIVSEIFNCELNKLNDIFFEPRPLQVEERKVVKHFQESPRPNVHDDEDDEEKEHDVVQDNQEEEEYTCFEQLEKHSDDNNLATTGELLRKSFGTSASAAPRSNRYQINDEDEDEVDHDEIELQADESLNAPVDNVFEHNQLDEQVKEEEEQNHLVDDDDEVHQVQENIHIVQEEEVQQNTDEVQEQEEKSDNHEQEVNQVVEVEQHDELVEQEQQNEVHHQNFDEDDELTMSTAPTMQDKAQKQSNPYELFEKFLSFLETDEDLNPVLAGYFCKLFQVLVGNKPREVFTYIYSHPVVLDNLVKHVAQKSVSEVLIRILNVTKNVFDDDFCEDIDAIRQSFAFKVLEKLDPINNTYEDHLNAQSLLSEIVEYKVIYQELTAPRSLEKFKLYLQSESTSSKANSYILLQNMVQKYKTNEHFSKKLNISNFQDCGDEMMIDEDDEDVLIFNEDNKESEFFTFIKQVITEDVARELAIPHEDDQEDFHPTQYGFCKLPFGIVRIRAVEFLNQAYQIFCKDIHQTMADADLYNTLLFFFEHYPFHNILHFQVCEIFTHALDKNNEAVINHFLYQTSLIKKILDTSRDGGVYTFQSTGLTLNRGFMAFIRKIANKLADLSKKNDEVSNFLESIPEWQEFYDQILTPINDLESKPLAADPRQRESKDDDYFDLICSKLKDASRSGFANRNKNLIQETQDDNDEEHEEDEDEEEEQDEGQNGENQGNNKEFFFGNSDSLGATKKKQKSRNQAYQQQQEEEEDDEDFGRLILANNDDDDNQDQKENQYDLQQYCSNGDDQTKKPTWEDDNDYEHYDMNMQAEATEPLSLNDLVINEKKQDEPKSPHFSPVEEQTTPAQDFQEEILQTAQEDSKQGSEKSDFHEQFFWKVSIIADEAIDDLLKDYQ